MESNTTFWRHFTENFCFFVLKTVGSQVFLKVVCLLTPCFALIFWRCNCTGQDLIKSCKTVNAPSASVWHTFDVYARGFLSSGPFQKRTPFSDELTLLFKCNVPSSALQWAPDISSKRMCLVDVVLEELCRCGYLNFFKSSPTPKLLKYSLPICGRAVHFQWTERIHRNILALAHFSL